MPDWVRTESKPDSFKSQLKKAHGKRTMTANQKALRKQESKTCVNKSTDTGGMPVKSNQHHFKSFVATTSSTVHVYNTPTWGPRHLQPSNPSMRMWIVELRGTLHSDTDMNILKNCVGIKKIIISTCLLLFFLLLCRQVKVRIFF